LVSCEHISQSCLDAAFRYLSYRPRSEFELKMRLRKRGFDDSSVERVLLKLREQGIVDDTTFAQFWKENRESFSPRSRAMLQSELRRKGIAPYIIAEVAQGINEEASAYRAGQKKVRVLASSDYEGFHRRLGAFLKRRGFSYEVAHRTVDQLWQEREG
ncbi:MAG TPA: regulatory protein RecX, partial [Dehalococcoidia bacterium]|nr:regulatory protein RecX [Dehalococcoidia bacterium]